MRYVHELGSIAGAVLLTAAGVVFTGFTASASTVISCLGTETTSYDPPLTLEPKPTNFHAEGNYFLCLGGPTSAKGVDDGHAPSASCVSVSMPQATQVVKYNTGQTDVIHYDTAVTTRVGGFNIVTLTGTVISGPHQDSAAVKTVQLTPIPEPAGCVTNGLETVTGTTQLQIFG